MVKQALTRQRRGREDCRRRQLHTERLGGGMEQVERMRSGRSMSCESSEAGLAESQII